MAVRTFYLSSTLTDGWHSLTETVPGSNAALSPATGWIVSTGATLRSQVQPATERAATTFVGTTVPGPTLDTTLKDALRTPLISGVFAAGNWTVGLPVNFVTSAAANGRAVFRLWRSANADGSSATEITSSQAVGSTVTVSALVRSTATIALGAVTVANEYLFLQVAWERQSAAAMSSSDVNLWSGASGASVLATTDFVPTIPVATIASGSQVFKPRLAGLPTLRQIVFGHAPTASSTNPFNGIMGGTGAWSPTETNHQVPWPCSGIFRNLVLEIGASASFTLNYALRINGVSTALNVTIAPATSLTAVATTDVAVNAGDLVSLYYTFSGGTPGNTAARWALEFESDTPQESAYGQAIGASANDAAPRQTGAFAFHPTAAAGTAHLPQQVVAVAGTITRLSVRATANPGVGAGMTWYFNLNGVRQDGTGGTPDTACAVINTTLATSNFSLPITPGDLVMVEGVSTGTFSSVNWAVSHNFLAADPRHSVLGGSTGNITQLTQATPPIQKNIAPISNNTSFAQRSGTHTTIPVTFKGMRVYHQTAPGVGHFRTVQLWAGLIRGTQGATTGLTTTVTDTEQTQSDLTHEYTTATGALPDQLNMRYEEDGTAAGSFVSWGFAQINPTTPPLPDGDLILGATIASSVSLFAPTASIGGAGGAAALVGAASVAIAGTASLTTSVRLVGASTVAITASSSLTTAIRLTGVATATLTTASSLTTGIALTGAATVTVSASASAAATTFNDIRQQILNGLDSAQAEAAGWDALKATIPVSAVVRTSDTVVTITLPALASYAITADETITATVPGVAVTSGNPVVATPTITVLATVGVPAALAGAASLTITTASALTTAIALTGAATTTVTSTSVLSTAIRLSGAATVTVTSTSALTSAISLSGAATGTVTTASALSTAIRLAGAATTTVTTTSSLTTAISLAGLASLTITTTSALTAGSGLSGAASVTITGASALTTALPLVAAATLTVTGASTLSTAIRLASAATVTISTASALSSSIRLAGAGTVTVTTAGTLTTGLTLAGTASVVLTGASSLTTQVTLAGAASVVFTATSAMSAVGAALQGAATLTVITAAGLTTAIRLSGAASTTVTTTSAITTQIRLVGAAPVVITASAVLSSGAATLQGAASVTITTSSSLTTGLTLRGTAQIVVLASSSVATAIRLSGTASLVILATSSLAPAIVPTADVIIRIAADDLVYVLASDDLVYCVAADDVRCRLVADDVVCALAADDISLAA